MNKKIVIGTLFAIIMLAILPSISAVEYNAVKTNAQTIVEKANSLNNDLKGGNLLKILIKLFLARKQKGNSMSPLFIIILTILIAFYHL
ncbi:MAG: hypothetical protein NT038_08845 [Euryarchaeota archaeon]|nr:hypothetical protein [Euryarchaeota archaeon]